LCHDRVTSLMIGFLSREHSICLIYQAQRGFLFFLPMNPGLPKNPPLAWVDSLKLPSRRDSVTTPG
jgi:hypothetical protein